MSEVMEGKRPYGRRQEGNENRGDLQMLMYEAKRLGQRGEWGPNATSVNSRILELDPDNLVKSQFFCNFLQDGTSSSSCCCCCCCCSSSHESNFPLLSLDAWRIPLG